MARIDVLTPVHGSPNPNYFGSIYSVIEYSKCKCAFGEMQRSSENPDYKPEFHDPGRCPAGKHEIISQPLASMSIVHWARNTMVMNMRQNADYILFVDADMGLAPDTMDRLMSHGVDIVAGLCTRRTDPAVPNIRQWSDLNQNYEELCDYEDGALIEVDAVGTGVMLISRKVLEAVAEAYHPQAYHANGNGWWFEMMRFPHLDAESGEDISFCHAARRIGYKVYVDTTVQPYHFDWYGYSLEDYLPFKQARLDEIKERQAAQ